MSTVKLPTAEHIFEQLEGLIAEGRFSQGERLDEVSLAREFGVSRTPLREALRLLSAAGLVELIHNRGAFVRQPDFVRLVEMFEVMAELEAWCARLAAARVTAAQLMLLRRAADGCERAFAAGDFRRYYDENAIFHGLIYDASGNSFLAEETRAMQRRLRPFRQAQLAAADRLRASMQEHRDILDALESGDTAAAERLMRSHIQVQAAVYGELRGEFAMRTLEQVSA